MKIFITGATGYIGGSLAKFLVDEGYEVYGLVRNKEKMAQIANLGIKPVSGTLEDANILTEYANMVDVVINAADSDHKFSVKTFIQALKGTGKAFLHTSGSSVIGDDAQGQYKNKQIYKDDDPFTPIKIRQERAAINRDVRVSGIETGIRAMVITPPMIYGDTLGVPAVSDQLPKLIEKSKEKSAGIYLGKGVNCWSNVHIKDLVRLYLLAFKKGPSAAMFFAENGELTFLEIAQTVSHALGFNGKTMSWPIKDAINELGDWARFALGSNSRIQAINARKLLGWQPKEEPLLDWIKSNVCRIK